MDSLFKKRNSARVETSERGGKGRRRGRGGGRGATTGKKKLINRCLVIPCFNAAGIKELHLKLTEDKTFLLSFSPTCTTRKRERKEG
jgi:hypothetical protein